MRKKNLRRRFYTDISDNNRELKLIFSKISSADGIIDVIRLCLCMDNEYSARIDQTALPMMRLLYDTMLMQVRWRFRRSIDRFYIVCCSYLGCHSDVSTFKLYQSFISTSFNMFHQIFSTKFNNKTSFNTQNSFSKFIQSFKIKMDSRYPYTSLLSFLNRIYPF